MTKSTIFGKYQGYDIKVGNVYETNAPTTLYPRQAANELCAIKDVLGFKVNDLKKAGRRFTCEFYDATRKTVLIKRVYREYVESLIDQLGLTPTSTQAESPAVAENVDSQA